MTRLLIEHQADINSKNNDGLMPLHYAAQKGYLKVCEILIENGVDKNVGDKDGDTPLHLLLLKAMLKYANSCLKTRLKKIQEQMMEELHLIQLLLRDI